MGIRKRKELKTIELERRIMYYSALVALFLLLVVAVVFRIFGNDILRSSNECRFHEMTGLYCPGCGGTRAFYCLVHFQLIKSLYYHFVVMYGILAMALYALNCFLYRRIAKFNFILNPFVLLSSGAVLLLLRVLAVNLLYLVTKVPFL